MADALFMAAAPEVGIPLEAAKQLVPHVPTFAMIPLVILALILIIIGTIVLAAAQNKVPGVIITILGFLLGGGAFFIMARTEARVAAEKKRV